jgi:hypothetical protein
MKKIYIGQCEHLCNCCITDEECLKRYFHIVNPKNHNVECLVFCNDYLKLNASKNNENNFTYKENVVDFIEKEILKYLNIDKKYRPQTKSISNYNFSFMICEKPFLCIDISFKEAVEWYLESKNPFLLQKIKDEIIIFLNRLHFKKYKSKYQQLITLSNKLNSKVLMTYEEKEIILLELINETFKLTLK